MTAERNFSSPSQLDCLTVRPPIACGECPIMTDNGNCYVFDRVSSDNQRINTLGNDRLVNIYSPAGLYDRIENDQPLYDELLKGEWGLVYVDIRGQKWWNDKQSRIAGDDNIIAASKAIVDVVTRNFRVKDEHSDSLPSTERREPESPVEDLVWRVGGDEFAVLVRNVTPEQLAAKCAVLQDRLSVQNGLRSALSGRAPLIASVASSHISDIALREEADDIQHFKSRPISAVKLLAQYADKGHSVQKKLQYAEMRDLIIGQYTPILRPIVRKVWCPSDDRDIAARFLELFYVPNVDQPDNWFKSQIYMATGSARY